MRLAIFHPVRPMSQPDNRKVTAVTFAAPEYDLYLHEGAVYVCKNNCVGVYREFGYGLLSPAAAREKATRLLALYPRESPVPTSQPARAQTVVLTTAAPTATIAVPVPATETPRDRMAKAREAKKAKAEKGMPDAHAEARREALEIIAKQNAASAAQQAQASSGEE